MDKPASKAGEGFACFLNEKKEKGKRKKDIDRYKTYEQIDRQFSSCLF